MKKFSFLFVLLIVSLFTLNANPDSLLAQYPLVSDGIDVTGNNVEMMIKNAPFQNGGIYSNGIYIGNDTTGSLIKTPLLNDFNFEEFTISIDFRIESYPSSKNPILIGGALWRWIGAYVDGDHLAFMANDGSDYVITDEVITLDKWNILGLTYNKAQKQATMYFNGRLVADVFIPLLEHNDDGRFLNEHGGTGDTFKGLWRNLQTFNQIGLLAVAEFNELERIDVSVFHGYLKILLPQNEKDVNMQIIDVLGKQLGTHSLTEGAIRIHTGLIKSGTYLLVFTNSKGQKAVKKIFISN